MRRFFNRVQCRDGLLATLFLLSSGALLMWPRESAQSVVEGLELCGTILIPSLFPFFVLSSMMVELGLSRYPGRLLGPIMAPLFRLNPSCSGALVLGWIGGYPVGARTAISLYKKGECSKSEAEHLLAFCNNAGPAFALGVVGSGLLGSSILGLLLYLAHLLSSLLVGIFLRPPSQNPRKPHIPRSSCSFSPSFPSALTHAVTGAAQSLLNLCSFVLFFSVVVRCAALAGLLSALARPFSLLGIPTTLTLPLLTGSLELSSGVLSLSGHSPLFHRAVTVAFLMGWAGLSVHCQVLALNDCSLSMKPYLQGKLLHGIFSAALTAALLRFLPPQLCAAGAFPDPLNFPLPTDPMYWLSVSLFWACSVCLLLLLLLLQERKKSSGNTRRHGL